MSAEKLNLTYHSNCITLQYKIRYVLHFGTIQPLTVLQNLRNTSGRMLLLVILQTINLQLY